MKKNTLSSVFFRRNRAKTIERIDYDSVIILFSAKERLRNGDQYFPYRQDSDFFYLSGIEQKNSILLLYSGKESKDVNEILFVSKPDRKTKIWYGPHLSRKEAAVISGIDNVHWLKDFISISTEIISRSQKVYVKNLHELSHHHGDNVADKKLFDELNKQIRKKNIQELTDQISSARVVKESEEIEVIKKGCKITSDAFRRIISIISPGMFEYEIEAAIISEFISKGASGHAFEPIVASGKNACTLHYTANDSKIRNNDLVLIDFGAEFMGYASDCSRTIPASGKFTSRQKEVYMSVFNVFSELKKCFTPGSSIVEVNLLAAKLIERELLELGLITAEDIKRQGPNTPAYKKFLMHGISHFMGLDVHDVGDKTLIFKKGMVLTCEPGIYIPKEGIGIRIETDIVVDDDPLDLFADIPSDPDEIEKIMASR